MFKRKSFTAPLLIIGLFALTAQQTALAEIKLQRWVYTGNDTVPGGLMSIINMADGYTDEDFIHMAIEYMNSLSDNPFPIVFQWSTFSFNAYGELIDEDGNVIPAHEYSSRVDGNVAVITADFSPGLWDGAVIPYNEFGESCVDIRDLSLEDVKINNKCQAPRDVTVRRSPNIAYAAIYLNTNGDSTMSPVQNKRRHLLLHEMGHILGLGHSDSCYPSPTPSQSVMIPDSDPSKCFGAPFVLQPEDHAALDTKYR